MCACCSRLYRSVRLGLVLVVCLCRYNYYGSSAGQSWMENTIPLTCMLSRVRFSTGAGK